MDWGLVSHVRMKIRVTGVASSKGANQPDCNALLNQTLSTSSKEILYLK